MCVCVFMSMSVSLFVSDSLSVCVCVWLLLSGVTVIAWRCIALYVSGLRCCDQSVWLRATRRAFPLYRRKETAAIIELYEVGSHW